jgi:hypothetical protein
VVAEWCCSRCRQLAHPREAVNTMGTRPALKRGRRTWVASCREAGL